MTMKIAILGGAGQIAWQLADWLRTQDGIEVTALCRSNLLAGPLLALGKPVRVFDSTKEESIRSALSQAEVVIDCTFASLPKTRHNDELTKFYTTVLSSPGVRYFVHLSSIAVYGVITAKSAVSFEQPEPDTIYGVQKLETEKVIQTVAASCGVPLLIARVGNVYGPWMSYSSLWANMIAGGSIDERQWPKPSNAIHIRQLCQAIAIAVEQRICGIWNALGSPNAPWSEVIAWHRQALRLIRPDVPETPEASITISPKRYSASAVASIRDVLQTIYRRSLSSIAEQPVLAQSIQRWVARFRFTPSMGAVKDAFGWDSMQTFFAPKTTDAASMIFDSSDIPGRNLPGADPLSATDFEELANYLRMIFLPKSVHAVIESQLALNASLARASQEG